MCKLGYLRFSETHRERTHKLSVFLSCRKIGSPFTQGTVHQQNLLAKSECNGESLKQLFCR